MNNAKKLLSLMIALMLILSLSVPVFGESADGEVYSAVVRFEEDTDEETLWEELEALPGVRVRWRYHALFSGAAIEGTRAALSLAGEQTGVAALAMSRMWTQAEPITNPLTQTNSLDVMNGLDVDYDGDGMVVAVIDSGLKYTHEAFQDYGNMDEYAISEEDIEAFVAEGGTDGRYISPKIPFVYDYNGDDRSVHTEDVHGTHVSALAVGYAVDWDGNVKFRGVAPAAQLLSMKVFPDDADLGASDADILKAIEDAYLLGADVINLSLGMMNAFYGDDRIGSVYSEVIAKLEADGVVVCCAVGNYSTALTGKTEGETLPSTGFTDYGTACAPAIYEGAVGIAAVNAAFYETGGGIMVGGKTLTYTEMISEVEGETLPNIEELSGQTLEYVIIDGLGKAEDFAGLDLTGRVAVIKRGEIYFTEKVQNAAEAGAVLCIVYNHEAGVILPAVNGTTIPSVMITKDAGKYLIEQAENGRGTMTIEPHRLLVSTGDRTAMLTFSSWGSSGLRIVPTLSAPGGMVMSASTSGNNLYEYLSGTSMAAPNAAGAYTIMLQAMRERGVEDRRERAELAKTLLESTATLVKNEMGVPVSLRQQGAGVIDISAALESKAVLKEPLLELGDSENGRFTMDLTVKNLSEKRMAFTIDTTVLTDAYVYSGGSWRSTLSSLDISDRVSISCVPRFSVEAGAERTVTLTLRLDQQLREELREVYPNGFYVEGYISLISDEKERIHATFLGYCGDWEAVPIIEQVDFRDVMDANFEQEAGDEDALASLTVDMGYNFAYLCDEGLDTYDARVLGENPWLVTRSYDERIAMTTAASDALLTRGDRFLVELYTLRNAEHVIMLVADQKTGEIYHVSDQAYLSRSQVSDTLGAALPAARFIWDGTDINGELLPDGTAVDVLFYAWLEDEIRISQAYESNMGDENDEADYRWILKNEFDAYIEWEFSLVIDIEAPVVSCETNEDSGTVTVFINEEQFVAYVSVQDGQGTYLAEEVYADEQAGVQHVLTVAPENGTEETLYITVADYAGNITGYEVDCSTMQAKQCPVAMLNDVENNAWYHEAVDYVIENGLMTADNSLYFTPEGGATRVQLLNILYDLAGNPEMTEVDVELPFGDVRGVEDFLPTLKWAYSNGIVTGYSDAFFGAYAPLLRAQMAAMLYRAAVATGEEPDIMSGAAEVFADADQIPDWAADAVVWAAEQGYLAADEDGCVNPMAIVTRAELAYLMMIFYQGT